MLATHTLSSSLHTSSPTTRPRPPLSSRTALADSTNFKPHSTACSPVYPKSCVYPTSSARTGCGWNDPTGFISAAPHSRHHHLSSAPPPFPVTSKAPPTVSISLSAAGSQSVPGERLCSSQVLGLEPDLPDVRSVVPFPSTSLDGDMDVDMFDGTRVPCSDGRFPPARLAPRKRHSAHSSISSLPGSIAKDMKQKRPRKSKRQVAELWWLGVVHRSILRGIEARQSVGALDASDRLVSGLRELDAMDRVLVEKIQRRLDENGCVEGRALPNPLPRISSPSISVPSLNLVAPSRKTVATGSAPLSLVSELNPTGSGVLDGLVTSGPTCEAPPCVSLSITSHSHSHTPTSSSITSPKRHVRFETLQRPHQAPLHPSIPRRSPSPPPRTGTIGNTQMLTLTMPQLVASLTFAYHERSGPRLRGRTLTERRKNAGSSLPSVSSRSVRCSGDASYDKERVLQSFTSPTRPSCAPERKSPLSRVVCAES